MATSLTTRGSNPGSALGLSLDHRMIAASKEQAAFASQVSQATGTEVPNAGVVDLPSTDTNLVWQNDQTTATREIYMTWNFSLNEAANSKDAVTWKTNPDDAWMFQKKKTNDPSAPEHDRVRVGNIQKAVIEKAKIIKVNSTLPFDVALQISGIQGRTYGTSGMRAPYVIFGGECHHNKSTVHVINPAHAELLKRRHTRVSEAYLDSQWTAAPSGDRVFVKVKSDFTDCMRINSNQLRVNFSNIPVFGGTEYIISTRLMKALKTCLLANRGSVELPYVDLYKMNARLERTDGNEWTNTDVLQNTHDIAGLVGNELLNKRYNVSAILQIKYTIAAGSGWDNGAVKPEKSSAATPN